MNYDSLPQINYKKTFNKKTESIKKLIQQSLQIITCLGIPIDDLTPRNREKMAMALLAVGDVRTSSGFRRIKDANNDYAPKTRDIISFYNSHLGERISSGSYDDVRRKDLKRLILSGIVVSSKPTANSSNPTRGYKISTEYARIIRNYGQPDWFTQVMQFNSMHPTYQERISPTRNLPRIAVTTPSGEVIHLQDGEHNAIQKHIIEELLPRYGNGAVLLYCGDANNKYGLVFEQDQLSQLGFEDLTQNKLPDIVAYSPEKDWVYLIEAYHTSNPITPQRKYELEQMMGESSKKAIFITAFDNITSYKNCPEDLAWETEVWIATDPDHMIHRNGSRFMGPYGN